MHGNRLRTRGLAALAAVLALAAGALALAGEAAPHATAASCRVRGVVLDVRGDPVPGIRVQLAQDRELTNQATDAEGRYDFGLLSDPGLRRISVELISEEYAHNPRRFQVLAWQSLGVLRSDTFGFDDEGGCERDFQLAAIPASYRAQWPSKEEWPDLLEVYQRTQRAWALADEIGERVSYGLPLRVYAWCDDVRLGCTPSADFAGFAGTRSDGSYTTSRPYVVLGTETSAREHGDVPDNREYHEFGHYFLADLFGRSLPLHPDNAPHGGYYRNPSSSDSWTEGFAEFYSLMVAKHVDGEPSPERYRIRGAEYDVELDHLAWEWAGWWEELSLAGLLLDFEDGDADYRSRAPSRELRVDSQRVRRIDGGVVVEGGVTNTSWRPLAYPEVVVELLDDWGGVLFRTAAPASPARLDPGAEGEFIVPVPEGLAATRVRVTPGPLPLRDDDPIDVTLGQLIDAIKDYRSEHEHGNGYVFDVNELYRALSEAFGGRDHDRDGVDDVEQVFRAHGFFADLDGSRSWRGGEAAGLTSHPAYEGYPSFLPRPDLPVAPEAMVVIDSGGVATHAVVYLTYAPPHTARSYGYVAAIEDDAIVLAAPPQGYDARVTILLLADGYRPAVVAEFDNEQLWDHWEQAPGRSIIEFEATLQPNDGDASDDDVDVLLPAAAGSASDSWSSLPPLWMLVVAAEIAIVAGFAGYVSLSRVRGRD